MNGNKNKNENQTSYWRQISMVCDMPAWLSISHVGNTSQSNSQLLMNKSQKTKMKKKKA